MQRELSDTTVQLKEIERKQRRFDQQLAEERNNSSRVQQELYECQQQVNI